MAAKLLRYAINECRDICITSLFYAAIMLLGGVLLVPIYFFYPQLILGMIYG